MFFQLKEQEPDIVTLYMDVYSTQNLSDFIQLFASSVLGKLDSAPQKAMNRINRFIRSCRPLFTLDELTGTPQITIDVAPANEQTTLGEIFDYLRSSEKRCYIAIDEFQQIAEYPENGVEALLRSRIQFLNNVNFIFSGSKQHVMQEMFFSAKRPFYQSTQIISIDRIDQETYFRFAANFFTKQGRGLDKGTFSYLYNQFEGHTWYIQAILNRLYSYKQSIDTRLIDYAVSAIVSESEYAYEILLAGYSSNNVKLLKAIAKEKRVKEINAGSFIAKYKLKAASSINTAI